MGSCVSHQHQAGLFVERCTVSTATVEDPATFSTVRIREDNRLTVAREAIT